MRRAALLATLCLGCSAARDVRVTIVSPRAVVTPPAAPLRIGTIALAPLGDLDVAAEARRFLEAELRARLAGALTVVAPGAAADSAYVLSGTGTFEEQVLGSLGSALSEPPGPVPERSRLAPGRTRWTRGYTLRLQLELRAPGADAPVWTYTARQVEPPRLGSGPLIGLYEVLGPVADAVAAALVGRKSEETRRLILR